MIFTRTLVPASYMWVTLIICRWVVACKSLTLNEAVHTRRVRTSTSYYRAMIRAWCAQLPQFAPLIAHRILGGRKGGVHYNLCLEVLKHTFIYALTMVGIDWSLLYSRDPIRVFKRGRIWLFTTHSRTFVLFYYRKKACKFSVAQNLR